MAAPWSWEFQNSWIRPRALRKLFTRAKVGEDYGMKDINEVIQQKQAQMAVLQEQILMLKEVARMLQEEEGAVLMPAVPTANAGTTSGQGTGKRWP
jgi:hypothetical protein